MHGIPGMYAPEHIRAWKVVTDAVHAKGAYMACQLWHGSLTFTPFRSPADDIYSADVSQCLCRREGASH
jgi:2,4-dienoyl-CoA reductase-like NADH-dependent reductase (Old Yellow Enzyme family)